MQLERRIKCLQEELAWEDDSLQHYEIELQCAEDLQAELNAARQKIVEQAVVIRTMDYTNKKQKMELAEIVGKCRNRESEIAALKKTVSERDNEIARKIHQLCLCRAQLNHGPHLKQQKMQDKVEDVFRLLRNKESEFYDLQSQVTMKKKEIERLGTLLEMAAHDLTRYKEENIRLNTKIKDLENQCHSTIKKKDEAERHNQPLSCTTQMLEQTDIPHGNLYFQAKCQYESTSGKAVLMETSVINGRKTFLGIPLPTKHTKNPTKIIEDGMDWESSPLASPLPMKHNR
jgi:chromosome segregation ATPase